MKTTLILVVTLLTLAMTQFAMAADVTFTWTPNTEPTLAGYKIYSSSTASGAYDTSTDVGTAIDPATGLVVATVTGYIPGATYYFAATAHDVDGFESAFSDEVVWTAPEDTTLPPQPGDPSIASPGLAIFPVTKNADGTYSTDINGIVVTTNPAN
jgi:hypothetical protein